MIKKICNICNIEKFITDFEKTIGKNKKVYYRNKCKSCKNQKDYKKIKNDPVKWKDKLAKNSAKRWDPKKRSYFILSDSKLYDKKFNLQNNLDKKFIEKLISKGCSYCQTSDFKIGLDRIDNSIGHIKSNVVPACTRCNFIRRDMPYKAWIIFVPAIRQVTKEGLFKNWTCGFNHHKKRIIE